MNHCRRYTTVIQLLNVLRQAAGHPCLLPMWRYGGEPRVSQHSPNLRRGLSPLPHYTCITPLKGFSLYFGPGAQGIPTHKISLSNGPRHPSVCLCPTVAERVRAPGEDGEPGVALSLVAAVTAILDKRRGMM